jgi:class 3 adenylate cyclase
MLELADRLRQEAGGVLDDEAIEAVAVATGAPADYVRIAVSSSSEEDIGQRQTLIEKIREFALAVDARLRRSLMIGSLGIGSGLFLALSRGLNNGSELTSSVAFAFTLGGLIYASMASARSLSMVLGAVLGATAYFMHQLVAVLWGIFPMATGPSEYAWTMVLSMTVLGAALAGGGHSLWRSIGKRLGLRDSQDERRELVAQLMEIQDKLKAEEHEAVFLSIDIVGSTRMKSENDALAIEYTFGEYHKFVESLVHKHTGRVHSTAGDGVICVFHSSESGFDAARSIMAGLFEFNAFRNRTVSPIQVRAGLHSGTVIAPGRDTKGVNFAHVIDIAAHLQKEADVGTLAVSEDAIDQIEGDWPGTADMIEVEGVKAKLWKPRSTLAETFESDRI